MIVTHLTAGWIRSATLSRTDHSGSGVRPSSLLLYSGTCHFTLKLR